MKILGEVNELRKLCGMKELTYKKRKCLKCGKSFTSEGPHNMCCNWCRWCNGVTDSE